MSKSELYKLWLDAKKRESDAVADRRKIEDMLIVQHGIDDQAEGSKSFAECGYRVTVTTRINRRVDGDKLQEIAAENGLSDHLSTLFRWKPEINMAVWKAADEAITKPLAPAITAKPGRSSFNITRKEK